MVTKPRKLTPDLTKALKEAALLPRDAAAVGLAKRYAAALDEDAATPDLLADLGPKLLRVLESLGMTPGGRAVRKEPAGGPVSGTALDELRARRARRARGAGAD